MGLLRILKQKDWLDEQAFQKISWHAKTWVTHQLDKTLSQPKRAPIIIMEDAKKLAYQLWHFSPINRSRKIRKIAASNLEKGALDILADVQVKKADSIIDVKDAVVQVWVCQK